MAGALNNLPEHHPAAAIAGLIVLLALAAPVRSGRPPESTNSRPNPPNRRPSQGQSSKPSNGKFAWRTSAPGRSESSPLVVGNEVIGGCECGSVYAFNAQWGKQLWSPPVGGGVKASPAYSNGVVYAG